MTPAKKNKEDNRAKALRRKEENFNTDKHGLKKMNTDDFYMFNSKYPKIRVHL